MTNILTNVTVHMDKVKVLYKGIAHTSIFLLVLFTVSFFLYMIYTSKSFKIKTLGLELERVKDDRKKTNKRKIKKTK